VHKIWIDIGLLKGRVRKLFAAAKFVWQIGWGVNQFTIWSAAQYNVLTSLPPHALLSLLLAAFRHFDLSLHNRIRTPLASVGTLLGRLITGTSFTLISTLTLIWPWHCYLNWPWPCIVRQITFLTELLPCFLFAWDKLRSYPWISSYKYIIFIIILLVFIILYITLLE